MSTRERLTRGAALRSARRVGLGALLVALALALGGCISNPASEPRLVLVNDTGQAVRITSVAAGTDPDRRQADFTLAAGEQREVFYDLPVIGDCTTGDIVVSTLDGTEILRLPAPVCEGSEISLAHPGLPIVNDLAQAVRIGFERDGSAAPVHALQGDVIAPGQTKEFLFDIWARGAWAGTIIVDALDGREIGRTPPQVHVHAMAPLTLAGIHFVGYPRATRARDEYHGVVRILYVHDGVEQLVAEDFMGFETTVTVAADRFPGVPAHGCTSGDIVLREEVSGREIRRFPPPVCDGAWLTAWPPPAASPAP